MPEPVASQGKPRTLRPIALWTAGILLALGLAWFVGAVVVPLAQLRAEIAELKVESGLPLGLDYPANYGRMEPDARAVWLIERMGGAGPASRRIRQYLGTPRAAAPERATAVYLLGFCGVHAVDDLIGRLDDEDPKIRTCAIEALAMIGPDAKQAASKLRAFGQDPDKRIREAALEAFSRVNYTSTPWDENWWFSCHGVDRTAVAPVERDLSRKCAAGDHGYLIGELKVRQSHSGSSNFYIHQPGDPDDEGLPALLVNEDLRKAKKGVAQKFYGVVIGDGHKNYIATLLVYAVKDR